MEPITSAIVAALVSGINSVGSDAVKDSYGALKSWLIKNVPNKSKTSDALVALEISPESESTQKQLNAELVEAKVSQNAELETLRQALIEKLGTFDKGRATLSKFNIQAEKIGVVSENVTIESLNF